MTPPSYDACETHGNLLRHAVTEDNRYVTLAQALKNPQASYFCPGCGISLYPEGGKEDITRNFYRKGHFNKMPRPTFKKGQEKVSQLELAINVMAANLRYSKDFSDIATNVTYVSERKKGDVWQEHKSYPIQLYARRGGYDPITALIHVVEMPLKRARDLYSPLKEIAGEPSPGEKHRSIYTEDGQVELQKAVHQNIVTIKDPRSFRQSKKGRLELTPTLYNFIGYLTGTINYFNPSNLYLEDVSIHEGEPVGKPEENPNQYFTFSFNQLPHFSLEPKDPVRKQRELSNWKGRYGVFIPKWKVAGFIPVIVNENGDPRIVKRKDGQLEFLL